jgi:hypothetical protein
MLVSSMDISCLLEPASAAPLPRIAITGFAFSARAANDNATVALPSSAMNARLLIRSPHRR